MKINIASRRILTLTSLLTLASTNALAVTANNVVCTRCINTSDLANVAVTNQKITNGAVTNSKIAPDAVTAAKIAPNAVGSSEIAPNAVGSSEIAPDAVTAAKIAPDAVGSSEIAPNAVGSAEIAPSAIGSGQVLDDSLTAADLGPGSVGASELGVNAVNRFTTTDEPGIDFTQSDNGGQTFAVPLDWTWLEQVVISAPSSGFVNCIASGEVRVLDSAANGNMQGGWDIDDSTVAAPDAWFTFYYPPNNGAARLPVFAMRTYSVNAGTHTFYLKMRTTTGDATDFGYVPQSTACMFYPTRY